MCVVIDPRHVQRICQTAKELKCFLPHPIPNTEPPLPRAAIRAAQEARQHIARNSDGVQNVACCQY